MIFLHLLLLAFCGVLAVRSQNPHELPCNNVKFKHDEHGNLNGLIEVPLQKIDSDRVDLELQLTVEDSPQAARFISTSSKIIPYLQTHSIKYKILLPSWREQFPRITRILVNGVLICNEQEGHINSRSTTTTLKSTVRAQNLPALQNRLKRSPQRGDPSKVYPKNPFFNPLLLKRTSVTMHGSSAKGTTMDQLASNPFLKDVLQPDIDVRFGSK